TSVTCTCCVPQLLHVPCSHMIAACRIRGVSHLSPAYMSLLYSKNTILKTWESRFEPILDPAHWPDVAKMASHAIFQYNVLAIDDTHNTWTNMIVKMTILRLLGSSDDKEKIGVARPKGPPLRKNRRHDTLVQKGIEAKSAYRHRLNRRSKKGHRYNGRPLYQRRCQMPRRSFFSTGSTDGASVHTTGVMTSAFRKRFLQHRLNRRSKKGHRCIGSPLYQR